MEDIKEKQDALFILCKNINRQLKKAEKFTIDPYKVQCTITDVKLTIILNGDYRWI